MKDYQLSIVSATTGSRYSLSFGESEENMKSVIAQIDKCLEGKSAFLRISNDEEVTIILPAAVLLSSIIQLKPKEVVPNG